MEEAGSQRHTPAAIAASLALIAAGAVVALYAYRQSAVMPTTDDASIDADVVHVAAEVGGRIVRIPVEENSYVRTGDLLFQIDPEPYQFAVDQARAGLDMAQAALETDRRSLSTQRSAALVAADTTRSAQTNLALANRTVARLGPLTASGYVPVQQFDQAQSSQRDADTALLQAREQAVSALHAIDTENQALASVAEHRAELAIAERHLRDTAVRATHAGFVVGLSVLSGEMVSAGQTLFTLVGTGEWYAVGNFRETDLHAIMKGDCATVYAMINRTFAMKATVQGIGAGVRDSDKIDLPRSVPYVERSLNWVIVAQRFPVRLRLINPPLDLVRLGATAIVEVKHGPACR